MQVAGQRATTVQATDVSADRVEDREQREAAERHVKRVGFAAWPPQQLVLRVDL